MSFYYPVTWREAVDIRRELDARFIPSEMRTVPGGSLAFGFQPVMYVRVRTIFGCDGKALYF